MRIPRTKYMADFKLVDKRLIEKIIGFPEHGMGYTLVDVTLFNGTTIPQVPVSNNGLVSF